MKTKPVTEKKPANPSKNIFGKISNGKPKRRDKNNSNQSGERPKKNELQSNGHAEAGEDEKEENGYDSDDMRDMLDEEDVQHFQEKRKRSDQADADNAAALENKYGKDRDQEMALNKKKTIDLLPIKTKKGEIITRTTEVDLESKKMEIDEGEDEDDAEEGEEIIDSDDEILNDTSVCIFHEALCLITNSFIILFCRVT